MSRPTADTVIPELGAIEPVGDDRRPSPDAVTAVFAGAARGAHDVVISGADARAWFGTAVLAEDLVFALWPAPEASLVVYAGADHGSVADRLNNGTVVLVAGGGLDGDVAHVVKRRVSLAPGVTEFFGLGPGQVVMSAEDPAVAVRRIAGGAAHGAMALGLLGALITIRAGSTSEIGVALVGHVRSSFTMRRAARPGPTLISRVAWTRALGSFQERTVDSLAGIDRVLDGALGPAATIAGRADADARVTALLTGRDTGDQGADTAGYDIVAAADPGGVTTFVSDVGLGFGDVGPVIVTGSAVPPRSAVILRGGAAVAARSRPQAAPVDVLGAAGGVVVGPPPPEDRDRFLAHQWAASQRRAADALAALGPDQADADPVIASVLQGAHAPSSFTLADEARAVGLIGPIGSVGPVAAIDPDNPAPEAAGLVDGATLAAIARRRGWHVIDPSLPPVLDPVLRAAHRQISGDDSPIGTEHLAPLQELAAEPGFWGELLGATEAPTEGRDDVIIFPYPAPSVGILRAVVAADGQAAELRNLLGPIRVAVMAALRGPGATRAPAPDQIEGSSDA